MPRRLVPTDVAIPSALLVNELVTNAFKHAFPDERLGEVAVALQPSPDEIRLNVATTGLPHGFRIDTAGHSLGKRVIVAFTRQLNDKMTAVTGERRT